MLLCYSCYITEKIQLQSSALLGHAVRTGEHPGILQQSTARSGLFSNAQVIAGLNALRMNVCVNSQTWGNAEGRRNVQADFFLSSPWTISSVIWQDSLHACTFLVLAFDTF